VKTPEATQGVTPTRVFLVPLTHWDREWYEPFEGFLARLVEMMDHLLELADANPPLAHFHLDGQSAMIDDYLALRPERKGDIEWLAREGRISVGPWFTQMDEFLTSGESMIRNLEWGTARARGLGTEPVPAGYLPDQFGHIGQMPQILANAGIDKAVVWRGVPSAIDKTAFWWESPDGSRVLAEYLVFGYGFGGWLYQAENADELSGYLAKAIEMLAPSSRRCSMKQIAPRTSPPRSHPSPRIWMGPPPTACPSGEESSGRPRGRTSCQACTQLVSIRSGSGQPLRPCWSEWLNRSPRWFRSSSGPRRISTKPGGCSCGTARMTQCAAARSMR
jgi:hypothetical protein